MFERSIKSIHQFRSDSIVMDNRQLRFREKIHTKTTPDGYFRLDQGTYEVVFNEKFECELYGVFDYFAANAITFEKNVYQTADGTATLMHVHCGHLMIAPGTVVSSIEEPIVVLPEPELLLETVVPDVSTDEVVSVVETPVPEKRKPGRPPKAKEPIINE